VASGLKGEGRNAEVFKKGTQNREPCQVASGLKGEGRNAEVVKKGTQNREPCQVGRREDEKEGAEKKALVLWCS
jgi:hypothetical protein